jgi:hypothetical protein
VVLLTDGVSSLSLYEENPIPRAVTYARSNNVIIHTIGVGTQTPTGAGAFIPGLHSEAVTFDEQNLQLIASSTGGEYAWARSPEQLEAAYERIIDEGSIAVVPLRLSFGFLFLALILLFLEWGLTNTRYRLLP